MWSWQIDGEKKSESELVKKKCSSCADIITPPVRMAGRKVVNNQII